MPSDLAVVCGATGGLGTALVAHFAGRGARVVAVARNAEELQALREKGGEAVRGEQADLTVPDEVEALWRRLEERGDRPRWLVNAVGGHPPGPGGTVPPRADP